MPPGQARAVWSRSQVNNLVMRRLRVAAAQMNTSVGDLAGNTAAAIAWIDRARDTNADLVVFPELTVTGYPPEDLLLKPDFIDENLACLARIANAATGIVAVVGFVDLDRDIYNAAAVCAGGEVKGVYRKTLLPNYGVFDEYRYFAAGHGPDRLFTVAGVRLGVSICEDAWAPDGPITDLGYGGAEVVVNLN